MKKEVRLSREIFTRLANNFYREQGQESSLHEIEFSSEVSNYVATKFNQDLPSYKVAMVCICLNEPYWQFAKDMIEGARQYFLPGHTVDFLLWSDMPPEITYGATVFPTEPVEWPLPTLMRYHLFLQQEEKLREYDYIFYCDIDMRFVDIVGDEILGDGLTAAEHPMYSLRPGLKFPVEPNPESASYIKLPEKYAAGGFQGGKTDAFITAMKAMKLMIDKDFTKNYTPIWNDESTWNKYLYDNKPAVFLSPSYVYPDSLINEYYVKVWGKNYHPRLMTITKKFTTSREGGAAVSELINTL